MENTVIWNASNGTEIKAVIGTSKSILDINLFVGGVQHHHGQKFNMLKTPMANGVVAVLGQVGLKQEILNKIMEVLKLNAPKINKKVSDMMDTLQAEIAKEGYCPKCGTHCYGDCS